MCAQKLNRAGHAVRAEGPRLPLLQRVEVRRGHLARQRVQRVGAVEFVIRRTLTTKSASLGAVVATHWSLPRRVVVGVRLDVHDDCGWMKSLGKIAVSVEILRWRVVVASDAGI